MACCRKMYEELIDQDYDVSDRDAMREHMYKLYNDRSELKICHSDFVCAYNSFLEMLDGNRIGRSAYNKTNCFRTMYLNVISIYNKYASKHLRHSTNVCHTLKDRIIKEYMANDSFPKPFLDHDLEYVVFTVLQFGKIGYSLMEQLDKAYGYDGDLPANDAMDILNKHTE